MSLTKKDLKQIKTIVNGALVKDRKLLLEQMFEHFVTKDEFYKEIEKLATRDEFMELKDMVLGIRNELDTEHEVRRKHIEENTKRSKRNEFEIKMMKNQLDISTSSD